MRWITRQNVKVDRVACPWLIRKLVDPDAEFVFLPQKIDWSRVRDGIVYDLPVVNSAIMGKMCPSTPSSKSTISLTPR